MRNVLFVVDGPPRGKPKATRIPASGDKASYESCIQEGWRKAAGDFRFPDKAFLRVTMIAYMKIPDGASNIQRDNMLQGIIRPTAKPDLDNMIKDVLTALNGHAYRDDAQVMQILSDKRYGEYPMLSVFIEAI